jgi:hypothetical protein
LLLLQAFVYEGICTAPRQIAEKPICGIFICQKKNSLNLRKILFAEIFICGNIYLPIFVISLLLLSKAE